MTVNQSSEHQSESACQDVTSVRLAVTLNQPLASSIPCGDNEPPPPQPGPAPPLPLLPEQPTGPLVPPPGPPVPPLGPPVPQPAVPALPPGQQAPELGPPAPPPGPPAPPGQLLGPRRPAPNQGPAPPPPPPPGPPPPPPGEPGLPHDQPPANRRMPDPDALDPRQINALLPIVGRINRKFSNKENRFLARGGSPIALHFPQNPLWRRVVNPFQLPELMSNKDIYDACFVSHQDLYKLRDDFIYPLIQLRAMQCNAKC